MTSPLPVQGPAYHRLALSVARPRWWRPIAVLVVAAALYLAGMVVVMTVVTVVSMTTPDLEAGFNRVLASDDFSDPLVATYLLLSIVALLPAALLAVRLVGGRSPGTLSSVAGRIRWQLLRRCLVAAGLIVTPLFLLLITLDGAWGALAVTERTLPIVAVALLIVPLQAAAEEYVFRGLLMQTIGGWLRHPAFAIVLPIPLFTLGHEYDALGLVDVTTFALVAGWLTWRTGGLEAAIGLHVVNNVVLILLGAFGLVDLNATEGSLIGLLGTLALLGTYAWVVHTWADGGSSSVPEMQDTRTDVSVGPGV